MGRGIGTGEKERKKNETTENTEGKLIKNSVTSSVY